MSIRILTAVVQDIPEINILEVKLTKNEEIWGDYYDHDYVKSPEWDKNLKKYIDSGLSFVAKDGEKIIGIVIGTLDRDYYHKRIPRAYLYNFFIDEGYRDQGLGTKLLDTFAKKATELGAKEIEIQSNAANEKALRFYEKNGYRKKNIIFTKEIL